MWLLGYNISRLQARCFYGKFWADEIPQIMFLLLARYVPNVAKRVYEISVRRSIY